MEEKTDEDIYVRRSKQMAGEFSRTELLIGADGMKMLEDACVMVFGVGGVGSHCIEALARSGVGELILIDNDKVSPSNINRQSIAYHSTIGQYKTQIMRERIADISPGTVVHTYETFVLEDNLDEVFLKNPDYIIDAIDTVTAKIAIVMKAWKENIPLISCMGTGNKLHPELFEIADIYETSVCPLCKVMRRELKRRNVPALRVLYSKEKPISAAGRGKDVISEGTLKSDHECVLDKRIPGSMSFVPPVAGLIVAGEVIRNLTDVDNRGN